MVLNQQIMLRSADLKAKQELAVAAPRPPEAVAPGSDAPPAEAMPLVPDAPPQPGLPRSPFDMGDGPAVPGNQAPGGLAVEANEQPPKVEPPLVVRDGRIELDPPPGYFDLPAPHNNDGTDPPIIKPGQILSIEVLEALPGRPITGERVVRPDGTISLGFYGDLRVAGLNRLQIKVKLIEHLRQFILDEPLGLVITDLDGRCKATPPVQSSRILVDESPNYVPAGQEKAGRPTVRGDAFSIKDQIKSDRIEMLEGKIMRATKELKDLRELLQADKMADPKIPITRDAGNPQQEAESFKKADTTSRLSMVESQLYKALKELDALKAEEAPALADPASSTKPAETKPAANPAEKPPG